MCASHSIRKLFACSLLRSVVAIYTQTCTASTPTLAPAPTHLLFVPPAVVHVVLLELVEISPGHLCLPSCVLVPFDLILQVMDFLILLEHKEMLSPRSTVSPRQSLSPSHENNPVQAQQHCVNLFLLMATVPIFHITQSEYQNTHHRHRC